MNTPGENQRYKYSPTKTVFPMAKIVLVSSGLLSIAMSPALANEWTFAPYTELSEQFTDNVFETSSNEKSDYITTVDVGFSITGETRRSNMEVSYNISQDYYAKYHELDGYRQSFLSSGTVELFEDHFFIDSRITFTQENLSQTGNTSAQDRTTAGGETQVFSGQISPYYIHDFAGWMTGIARYSYTETMFSEPDVGGAADEPADRSTNEFQMDLESGRRFTNTKWAFRNALISSDSDDSDSFDHFLSVVSGQYPINRYFSVLSTVGYDDFDADDIDNDDISGVFGGAGLRFHPNSRTDASIQVGHRFGDPVADFEASYSPTSLDTITASYHVSVETADQSLVNTDLLDEQGDIIRPNFSVTGYVDDVSKTELFTLNWSGSRGRNNYGLSGNYVEREFLSDSTDDQTLSIDTNIGRQLTRRANLSLRAGYSEVIDGQTKADEETVYSFGASYVYDFGRGLVGSASYDYLERDSNGGNDSRENAISLSVRKNF